MHTAAATALRTAAATYYPCTAAAAAGTRAAASALGLHVQEMPNHTDFAPAFCALRIHQAAKSRHPSRRLRKRPGKQPAIYWSRGRTCCTQHCQRCSGDAPPDARGPGTPQCALDCCAFCRANRARNDNLASLPLSTQEFCIFLVTHHQVRYAQLM